MSRYNCDDILANKIKVKDSVSKIAEDSFIQWHPQIDKILFKLNKNKNILNDSSHLSKSILKPPKVFYQRKCTLKDILCNSDTTKTMELMNQKRETGHAITQTVCHVLPLAKVNLSLRNKMIVNCSLEMVEPVRQKTLFIW